MGKGEASRTRQGCAEQGWAWGEQGSQVRTGQGGAALSGAMQGTAWRAVQDSAGRCRVKGNAGHCMGRAGVGQGGQSQDGGRAVCGQGKTAHAKDKAGQCRTSSAWAKRSRAARRTAGHGQCVTRQGKARQTKAGDRGNRQDKAEQAREIWGKAWPGQERAALGKTERDSAGVERPGRAGQGRAVRGRGGHGEERRAGQGGTWEGQDRAWFGPDRGGARWGIAGRVGQGSVL